MKPQNIFMNIRRIHGWKICVIGCIVNGYLLIHIKKQTSFSTCCKRSFLHDKYIMQWLCVRFNHSDMKRATKRNNEKKNSIWREYTTWNELLLRGQLFIPSQMTLLLFYIDWVDQFISFESIRSKHQSKQSKKERKRRSTLWWKLTPAEKFHKKK